METRPGEFGWSHTESEIQAAKKQITKNMDDEESNYYNKTVREDEKLLILHANLSRKKIYRCPSKFGKEPNTIMQRKSIQQRMTIIRAQIEAPPEQQEENTKENEEIRLETIAREGLKTLYEQQLDIGKGMQQGPFIMPYRFLGTPDLKRDDTLLPKTFQFAKREKFSTAVEPIVEICEKLENRPMVLPLELRAAYWNGGRWCGTTSTARQVAVESGFKCLYQEVVESEKRRVNCKGGKYFLRSAHTPRGSESDNSVGQNWGGRLSYVSEFTPRQKIERPSMTKPYIPPLPLKDLANFNLDEQLSFNQEIISAYRDESTYRERLTNERAKSPQYVSLQTEEERKKKIMFGTNGFPLKACEDSSLRQLETILQSKANFRAVQYDLNSKLVHSLKAMETARPYHYAREFNLKGGGHRRLKISSDPTATSRRANALRAYMEKCRWFEDLIALTYLNNRHPTKTELFIINNIRSVMDLSMDYGLDEYTNLIQRLGKKKMDMDSLTSEKALIHIQSSLQLDDVDILNNLVGTRSKLPLFLAQKTSLVQQVLRDLVPNRFPQSQWADRSKVRKKFSYHRPKIPSSSKLQKLVICQDHQKFSKITRKAETARF